MSSGEDNYREACGHYERGELEEAIKLFSKAIVYFFGNWESEKEAKAHYYRGCAYYRLGVKCEKNQMFQESNEKFDKALEDFKKVTERIKVQASLTHENDDEKDKNAKLSYYKGCAYYKLGVLYQKKGMSYKSRSNENFENALTCLEIASKSGIYKENGKLWFYKGIASYNLGKDEKDFIEDFKKAATYDYYDIEILRSILPERPCPVDNQQENLNNIFLLYYLKRYSKITTDYSNNPFHKECFPNLIKDYGFEGAYYCALSHYEFKEFERSLEILSKLTNLNEIPRRCRSFENQFDEEYIKKFEQAIKIDLNNNFNNISESCKELISKKKGLYPTLEFSELVKDMKIFQEVKDERVYDTFFKKIVPNSWYYKGLILHEVRNNFKDQGLLKVIFDGFETGSTEQDEKDFHNLVNEKDNKNLEDYKSNVEKKAKLASYLNEKIVDEETKAKENKKASDKELQIKLEKTFQKLYDLESQIAFEKALDRYNNIIESFQAFEFYYGKALVLDELKRYKEAIESLDEFLKVYPRNAKAWLKKGTILLKLAKSEGISTICEESRKENKEEENACQKEIVKIEAAKNALEKSIRYFKILIDENPGNPDHWYNKGTAHSSLAEVLVKTREYSNSVKEYEEAVKAFDNATVLNPIFALAWNNKGNAYLKLKKYNKAIEAFEKAHEINRNYYLALNNKGDALYSLGKYEEAIEIYKQVTGENDNKENSKKKEEDTEEESRQINTVSYKSYNNKGLALYKLGKYDEAIKAFDEAIKINSTFADGWINKGLIFYKLEMLSEAKEAFEEALKLDPGNTRASNSLGIVFASQGELDRAKKLFENTVQENPDFILGSANLAELLLNSGGIEEASKKIKCIPKDDNNPDPNMGYIHFLDGRIKIEDMESKEKKYSEAAKSFEKAASYNVEEPEYLLWSVYAKYLCEKFEIGKASDSSEEPKPGKENVSLKAEDTYSDELSHSIISDLAKISNFCDFDKTTRQILSQQINRYSWFNIPFILLSGLLFLIILVTLNLDIFGPVEFLMKDGILLILLSVTAALILLCFSLSFLLLGFSEKSFVFKKSICKPALWADQLLAFRIFKLEWIFERIKSYTKFIVSNDKYLEQKTEGQKSSDRQEDWELASLIKIKSELIKFDRYKEIKAYTLYLLGYFYYKLKDYTTAKEKLQECINLRPDARTDKSARELLDGIWKHKIKPPFWTYWLNSPVNTWRRRIFGALITLGILLILFVHLENPQPVALNASRSNNSENLIPDEINIYPYIISYYPLNNTSSGSTDSTEDDSNTDNDGTDADSDNTNNGNSVTTWNILTPARVNIYPYIVSYYPLNNTSSDSTDSVGNDNSAGNDNTITGSDNTNDNNNTTWNILTPARINIYPDIPDNYFDAILLLILILILISPSVRIAENIKLILKKGGDVSLDLGPIAAPPEFNFELSPSLMQDVIRRLDENL